MSLFSGSLGGDRISPFHIRGGHAAPHSRRACLRVHNSAVTGSSGNQTSNSSYIASIDAGLRFVMNGFILGTKRAVALLLGELC